MFPVGFDRFKNCAILTKPTAETEVLTGPRMRTRSTLSSYRQTLKGAQVHAVQYIVQELCDSRGGRPGLSVLTSLLASVDVKLY